MGIQQQSGYEGPNIKWGDHEGHENIRNLLENVHNEITTWKKNMFMIPKGKVGRDFISEVTRLIQLFNNKTVWEKLAMNLLHVFIPIMLQKPSAKSKGKDHTRYLNKRLEIWKKGKLIELMSECRVIQNRMKQTKERQTTSNNRGFTRLMLLGKVKQALKLINEENDIAGLHDITEDIREVLQSKHPNGESVKEEAILPDLNQTVEPVIYEEINAEVIKKAAKDTFGSGGPTQVDADIWKFFICSKTFGNTSEILCEEIAILARRLCVEDIPHESISSLLACRLVPLMKRPEGVRPIGIGEILRRIIGKSITRILREDIQTSSGTLQTCSGLESGIEAAIHAMKKVFSEESCEAVLLVDEDNAFNRLN